MSLRHATLMHRLAAPASWPVGTVHTADDVTIQGDSLTALAGHRDTPCVRIAPTPFAGHMTVVLTRVEEVTSDRTPRVRFDARLGRAEALLDTARVLGRASDGRRRRMHVQDEQHTWMLPRDLRVGDLVAIPCRTVLTPALIRRDDLPPHCRR